MFKLMSPPTTTAPATTRPSPLYLAGTVAEQASLDSAMNVQVSGYGIVVGLGKSGSGTTGVPPQVLTYLKEYLLKRGRLGSYREGTEKITPELILRDSGTAVVQVVANVPALAPVGTKYDIVVRALPQTQTASLEGGSLWPTELFLAIGGVVMPSGSTRRMAEAEGKIFVNPFLDPANGADQPRFREGRILNGGVVRQSAPLRLVLRHADYAMCALIQRRINERFPGNIKVANAVNSQIVDLTIPRRYHDDYVHFLDLVLHLPLTGGGSAWEDRARQIGKALEAPGANYEELALVLEAMGKQILPCVKDLYSSANPMASFYSARTGLRLDDALAMEAVIHHARDAHSPMRIAAIEEIGNNPQVFRGTEDLQELVNDPNEMIRVAAYEAMVQRGDHACIERTSMGTSLGRFCLDVVRGKRKQVIYATQSGQPKIVLLGGDIPVQKEVFFTSHNDDITINSAAEKGKLTVVRKIQFTGRYSDAFQVDRSVAALVKVLGASPEHGDNGKIMGLGLSYGQVAGVLSGMCKQKDIEASFVLQQPPNVRRIYENTPAAARPDLPER